MVGTQWPSGRDFSEAIQNPSISFVDPELKTAMPATDHLGMPLVAAGQFAYAFKLKRANGGALALRCFRGFLGDREQRYRAIQSQLSQVSVPGLASFKYDPQGIKMPVQRYPILKMRWIDGLPLDVYVSQIFQHADALKDLAGQWLVTIDSLKKAGVAHGDLQHGNIIVDKNEIHLVDLDGMYVPAMKGWKAAELGHRHYQHPARAAHHFSATLDSFSALVIYISLIAIAECPQLWTAHHDENLIFTKADFQSPGASPLFAKLRKLNAIQQLVAALEKGCGQDPLNCLSPLDLVKQPSSKLPSWMRTPLDVQIKIVTREDQALRVTPIPGPIAPPARPPSTPSPAGPTRTPNPIPPFVTPPFPRRRQTAPKQSGQNPLSRAAGCVIWFLLVGAISSVPKNCSQHLISKATDPDPAPPPETPATASPTPTPIPTPVMSATASPTPMRQPTPIPPRAMPATPSPTPTPQPTPISTPDAKSRTWPDGRILKHPERFIPTWVVNVAPNDTLKLRSGPGTRFGAITEIPADAVDIFAFDKDAVWDADTWWYPIEWHGFRGYVGGSYLPHDP